MPVNNSPEMNLPIPVVSSDPGPDWAQNLNSCLSAIDSHNHAPGYGVQISPDGININSDFPINNYQLTGVQAVEFESQVSLATQQAIYVSGVDLYYNDGSGNVIQITDSGSVAGASGTITGLPSGTASASYQSVGGTFRFQSATNTPANIDGATFIVREQAVSPSGISIKSPTSLASNYDLTLPTAVPAASSFVMMSSAGALSTRTITAPTVQKFTSGSGTYTRPAGVLYIKVKAVGGGGGGCSGQRTSVSAGSAGGNTTFGSSLITANGGAGGTSTTGGAGGTATINSPAVGTAIAGSQGGGPSVSSSGGGAANFSGGSGGTSPFGGAGGGKVNDAGQSAIANSGSGGGGGGSNATADNIAGSGGGSGGYVEAIIPSPSSTYSYAVGALGAGGAAGLGTAGGDGGSGYIIVEEFYQ